MGEISQDVSNAMSLGFSDAKYGVINGYNFVLRVEGLYDLPIRAIRGLNKQNEYEYVQEGGLNDYVHMLRKPISQPFTFTVERYVGREMIDPLANGTELALPVFLYIYRSGRQDDNMAPIRYYMFTNCRVMGKQYSDLDAEQSNIHMETTTIAYSQLTTFTMAIDAATTKDAFSFADEVKGTDQKKFATSVEDFLSVSADKSTSVADINKLDRRVRTPQQMATLSNDQRYDFKTNKVSHSKAWDKVHTNDKTKTLNSPYNQMSDFGNKTKEEMEQAAKEYRYVAHLDSAKELNKTHSKAWETVHTNPTTKKPNSPYDQLGQNGDKTIDEMIKTAADYRYPKGLSLTHSKAWEEAYSGSNDPEEQLSEAAKRKKSEMESIAKEKRYNASIDGKNALNPEHGEAWNDAHFDANGNLVSPYDQVSVAGSRTAEEMEELAYFFTPDSPEGQLSKEEMEEKATEFTPPSPPGQLSKSEMEGRANEDFVPDPPLGQLSKAEMEAKANIDFVPDPPPGQLSKPEMEGRANEDFVPDPPPGQLSKAEMEEKAYRYYIPDPPPGQLTKPEMEGRANEDFVPAPPPGQQSKSEMEGKSKKDFVPDPPPGQQSKSEMEGKSKKDFVPDPPPGQQSKSEMEGKSKKDFVPDPPKGQQSKSEMEKKAKKNYVPDPPKGQKSKKEMEKKAERYFTPDVPKNQKSKKEMEGRASKFPPKRSAKSVMDFLKK